MPDRHVSVTLTFRTDAPPSALAMAVGAAITNHVPDALTSIVWHGFDLDEEETPNA
ncbi:hypothetical protein STRCI_001313 [Streptomyces cinnabarinus]|uniref:Uncharacterized protein n=1 Tax=Streptomyces cinnabarinus TaxID=67287 RepID=A0ABY7KAQ5_9ACTN|nr:hypothetical protein [Streptomyces cinnabarinus]WAZ20212.1 hypothetical protein STRCI_001313 [Streptomyces cinnabarinus]